MFWEMGGIDISPIALHAQSASRRTRRASMRSRFSFTCSSCSSCRARTHEHASASQRAGAGGRAARGPIGGPATRAARPSCPSPATTPAVACTAQRSCERGCCDRYQRRRASLPHLLLQLVAIIQQRLDFSPSVSLFFVLFRILRPQLRSEAARMRSERVAPGLQVAMQLLRGRARTRFFCSLRNASAGFSPFFSFFPMLPAAGWLAEAATRCAAHFFFFLHFFRAYTVLVIGGWHTVQSEKRRNSAANFSQSGLSMCGCHGDGTSAVVVARRLPLTHGGSCHHQPHPARRGDRGRGRLGGHV